MKTLRRFITFSILLIAIGAGLYTQRVVILDWYANITQPALPEAISYDLVTQSEDVAEPMDEATVASLPSGDPADSLVQQTPEPLPENPAEESVPVAEPVPSPEPDPVQEVPASINLAVPFTSQAPHGNWDPPYKEACEEASIYMVHEYYEGRTEGQIDPDQADLDLLNLIAFEKELFGFYEDTTIEQTGTLAELMYGYSASEVMENPTVEQIQFELAHGRPVIVPAAGRLLGNPYFTAPGPVYHMFVIRGYTDDGRFIVNDPGTRNGEAYLYDFDTVLYAIHDWNTQEITEGRKAVLVIYP